MARIFAAADIGSNTAHLLIAATDGDIVMRLDNINEWVPLGEIVAAQGEIPKAQADILVEAMKDFRRAAAGRKADRLYVFATEAIRSAKNSRQVLQRINREAGVSVEVITPAREAELSFIGTRLDGREAKANLLFEVGGGSAQIASVDRATIAVDTSLPLGTGRLISEAGLKQPCDESALKKAVEYIQQILAETELPAVSTPVAIASGGVARGLWRALHPDGEKRLSREEIEYLIWATQRLTVETIIKRFSVKPKRAGTLLAGALVYQALLEKFGLDVITVSEFGVREGAVLEMLKKKNLGQDL